MVSYLGQRHARIIQAHVENGVLHLQVSANFDFKTKNMKNICTFLRWYSSKPVGKTTVDDPDMEAALEGDLCVKSAIPNHALPEAIKVLFPVVDAPTTMDLPPEDLDVSSDNLPPTPEPTEDASEQPGLITKPRTRKSKSKKISQRAKGGVSTLSRNRLGALSPNVVTRSRKTRKA